MPCQLVVSQRSICLVVCQLGWLNTKHNWILNFLTTDMAATLLSIVAWALIELRKKRESGLQGEIFTIKFEQLTDIINKNTFRKRKTLKMGLTKGLSKSILKKLPHSPRIRNLQGDEATRQQGEEATSRQGTTNKRTSIAASD